MYICTHPEFHRVFFGLNENQEQKQRKEKNNREMGIDYDARIWFGIRITENTHSKLESLCRHHHRESIAQKVTESSGLTIPGLAKIVVKYAVAPLDPFEEKLSLERNILNEWLSATFRPLQYDDVMPLEIGDGDESSRIHLLYFPLPEESSDVREAYDAVDHEAYIAFGQNPASLNHPMAKKSLTEFFANIDTIPLKTLCEALKIPFCEPTLQACPHIW